MLDGRPGCSLPDRARELSRRINVSEAGQPWLDEVRLNEAVSALERMAAPSVLQANRQATQLLLKGIVVAGDADLHQGREQVVHYRDWRNPQNNNFLAINQFRVDPPWAMGDRDFIVPDVVLFVNGIPLALPTPRRTPATSHRSNQD